jgi:ribosome-binding factor A
LSALTAVELRDPRIGLVTITEVRVTDDLKNAQVYVSVLGDAATRQATLVGLSKAASFLKREVTHRLALRFAPNLHFHYDESLAHAQRVDELLGAVARGDHEAPPPVTAEAMPEISLDRSVKPQAVPEAPAAPQHKRKSKTRSAPGQKSRTRRLTRR